MASVNASVRARLAVTPVWAWWAFLAIGAAGILVWHEWANVDQAHAEAAWLDPEQPLPNLEQITDQVRVPATRARTRTYPGSVPGWSCSKVGDC